MKRLVSNFPDRNKIANYGKCNELKLLGLEDDSPKKRGLNKVCPICGEYNFIPFKPAIREKVSQDVINTETKEVIKAYNIQGLKIISRINWVTCSKCNVSYSLS